MERGGVPYTEDDHRHQLRRCTFSVEPSPSSSHQVHHSRSLRISPSPHCLHRAHQQPRHHRCTPAAHRYCRHHLHLSLNFFDQTAEEKKTERERGQRIEEEDLSSGTCTVHLRVDFVAVVIAGSSSTIKGPSLLSLKNSSKKKGNTLFFFVQQTQYEENHLPCVTRARLKFCGPALDPPDPTCFGFDSIGPNLLPPATVQQAPEPIQHKQDLVFYYSRA